MQRFQPDDEQPSFELPQLPPWKALHMKQYNQQTPLRRPRCILGAPYESSSSLLHLPSVTIESVSGKLPEREYDYSVFNESRLLTESKIDQYMRSEIATHKRVFHRDKAHDDTYRPDLQPLCCDSSDDENDLLSKRLHKQRLEKPLVVGIPGLRPEELHWDSTGKNKRRSDYIADMDEEMGLRRYWNWSALSKSLGPRDYHMLNRILQKEVQLHEHYRDVILKGDGYARDVELSDDETYLGLKQYAHKCYDKDNCVFNMDELMLHMKEQD
ncbi:HBR045Cp [Eremothecium sinecaudum]|uniref:HBR045Cp n=1 Tax=Eremothecium sinecaudum TaxID=45286 RepID=A0A120K137_9SACH|nr:HBR045Cp [Eremothecium sinecaudum]AMD18946.1 HBR045Cp [Eremothecium sinecaudum]